MSGQFKSFAEFQTYLDGLGMFRMVPGLERIRAVLEALGLQRPPYAVVQIAGTNGKGSTSTMLASLATAHGLRTGVHLSPHFLSIRERVRVDGQMLDEALWVSLANEIMRFGGEALSYFEFVTVLAVLAFAGQDVQLAVMETGLGGSFDATTALEADLVLLSPIGLDHQAVLGESLKEIARDKAGAVRYQKPVISVQQEKDALEEIERAAAAQEAPLVFAGTGNILEGLHPRLSGDYQSVNANLALAGWRHLMHWFFPGFSAEPKTVRPDELEVKALEQAWLPGRLQSVPPLTAKEAGEKGIACLSPLGWPHLLLDGAHNIHAFSALGLSLAKRGTAPAAVIFSCLRDKDPEQLIPHLRALATGPIFVPPISGNPRSMPPIELAGMIGLNATPCESMRQAVELALSNMAERFQEAFSEKGRDHPLLVCGSLYLLGEFYALRPDCLE